jgi:serine/threonine protein kinase
MTWARTSFGRSVSRTGLFLRRQLWAWPIVAVVLLSIIGFTVRRSIERIMKQDLQSELQTLLRVEAAMLERWAQEQGANSQLAANDRAIREHIYALLNQQDADPPETAARPPEEVRRQLRRELAPFLSTYDYFGYFIADKSKRIIAASNEEILGRDDIQEYSATLAHALAGETVVSPPYNSLVAMKDDAGRLRTGLPAMFVCAPVRDANFQVVAALAMRLRPQAEFTHILQLGQMGESGETYAFDKSGLMVSNSRFDEQLMLIGLLPDQDGAQSILSLQVRDPGGDITQGFRPKVRRNELPLTHAVEQAITGKSGVDVAGYRDYRGVPVVGAWTWLPKYGIGLVTEIDRAEAFMPLTILQWTFWGLYVLLGLSSVAIFIFTVIVARLRREAQKAAIEAQQLGQYQLERKLGTGGMGVVYKGMHAMLRRPTAIKMLDVDKVNDESIQRFEREVQITCQLNHPNTIAIYDYGRTPEGVFYYAMEYLDGMNLQTLVDRYGPLGEARTIHILSQICGSLHEAHAIGLVHRDIKPANIMLNYRGNEPDVVKVLDFGLVKAVNETQKSTTVANSLTGTPLYMSPEAIQAPNLVDARSDLYAVGAVGFFLLTGQSVFDAATIVELCQKHISSIPDTPSKRTGRHISEQLEAALMACLEKSPFKRPASARELAQRLSRCPAAGKWSVDEADLWWTRHERGEQEANSFSTSPAPSTSVLDRTMVGPAEPDE